jgi:hypothetical protein
MPVVLISCSGSPLYICFVQINYTRKQQTGQPFLSCPVLFSGLMQQPLIFRTVAANFFSGLKQQFHAVFRLRTTVLADTVMLRQCSCEAQEAHRVSQRIRLR